MPSSSELEKERLGWLVVLHVSKCVNRCAPQSACGLLALRDGTQNSQRELSLAEPSHWLSCIFNLECFKLVSSMQLINACV